MNKSIRKFVKALSHTWNEGQPAPMAAALAFYSMFSFAPVVYIALTVASLFLDQLTTQAHIFDQLAGSLGQEAAEFIQAAVINVSSQGESSSLITTIVSAIVLLFVASGVFSQLRNALNAIWEVTSPTHSGVVAIIIDRLLAFVMVIGLGLVLVMTTVVSVSLSLIGNYIDLGPIMANLNPLASIIMATLVFAIIYKILPDTKIAWRDVWVGALVTSILFNIGRWGLSLYFSISNIGSAFEAAGALVIVLTAIYYLAMAFLFGAIFTKVYAEVFGTKAACDSQEEDQKTT